MKWCEAATTDKQADEIHSSYTTLSVVEIFKVSPNTRLEGFAATAEFRAFSGRGVLYRLFSHCQIVVIFIVSRMGLRHSRRSNPDLYLTPLGDTSDLSTIFQMAFQVHFQWKLTHLTSNVIDLFFFSYVHSTFQHWFKWWLGKDDFPSHHLNQWYPNYWWIKT